ncbi:transmembrane amino acid transporter protein-domain-containing protein [Umbelopsis sp. PMI_123]|nr:transmembrane amino acid transporter protein-domain-containing protein [Umbelopsis sp. PMI_123]
MVTDQSTYASYTDSGNTSRAPSTYSIISSDPSSYIITDETKPLLQSVSQLRNDSYRTDSANNGTASALSSIINLSNTILGTGMLAMPSAVASVGLIPGMFVIVFSGITSSLGLYFLSKAAARTEGREASFFAVSQLTWPSAAVFLISLSQSNVLVLIIKTIFNPSADLDYLLDRRLWITVFMVTIVGPLSFSRKLDSLKYTSVIALFAVAYLCLIVMWHFFSPDFPTAPSEEIELVHFSTKFFTSLPVFVFAFTCHQNIFSVYNEQKDNSQKKINTVIASSIGTAIFLYEGIAIMGYLSFGKAVMGNIILEYPASLFVTGGRVAIVILVLLSYPLQCHPCRNSLDKVLSFNSAPVDENGAKVLSPPSTAKFIAMTMGILITTYCVAITMTKLDIVLAFVGSTGSTVISFILPAMFYLKLHEGQPWTFSKITALCLGVYGCFVMVICLSYNIMHVANPSSH